MRTLQDQLTATKYRPSGFDYMRLVLATGVIVLHAVEVADGLNAAVAVWLGWFRPFVGVILPMFFALSGFLVAGSLERNKSMVSFLGLRVIRLMPALAVEITLSALILGPIFTDLPLSAYYTDPRFFRYFENVVGNIHYVLPGVFDSNPYPGVVNSQLWTIPFELKCYILLTFVAGIGLFGAKKLLLAAMVMLQLAVAVYLLLFSVVHHITVVGTVLVGCFLAGLTLYRWRDRIPFNGPLAALCAVLVCGLMYFPPVGDFFISFPLAYLTAYLGLLNPRRNRFFLSGDYSYGMYLYGYPIQQAFAALGAWTYFWWLNLLVTWPIAFGFAAFSWWCIEKPALRLRKPLLQAEERALRFRPFHAYSRLVFMANHDLSVQTRTS